jgi:hypothetical protein
MTIMSVSKLNIKKCFLEGLNINPKPTTADIIIVTKTDNKCACDILLNNDPLV